MVTAHVSAAEPAAMAVEDATLARRDELRAFHLSGAAPAAGAGLTGALFPLALGELAKPEQAFADWPLVIASGGQAERCAVFLQRALAGTQLLAGHSPRLVRALGKAVQDQDGPLALADAMATALPAVRSAFDLSDKGYASLDHDLELLRRATPAGALVLGFGPNAALWLYVLAAERRSADAGKALRAEVGELVSHLRQLLQQDDRHAPTGQSPEALSAILGGAGNLHVDTTALAGKLPIQAGTQRLQPERRARIEAAAATLDRWLAEPAVVGAAIAARALPPALGRRGWRTETAPEPVAAARVLFDQLASEAVPVVRACQVARLERAGRWEERHAALIDRLDWRAFDPSDWRFVPFVLASLRGVDEAAAAGPALAEIERTARPVRVLAAYVGSADPTVGLQAVGRALGLLALARPTGMQAATAVVEAEHLTQTLDRMTSTYAAAVVAVAEPQWAAEWPWLEAALAQLCQSTLCFSWSGLPGAGWADAFSLAATAQTNDWNGGAHESWSIAHAALVEPRLRGHFWFVPGEGPAAGLVQLEAWQVTPAEARSRLLPFVWARDAGGVVGRAVVSRELAQAADSQARWWRCLRELAGLDNPFAVRAVADATARIEAAAAAELAALAEKHLQEVQAARSEGQAAALDDLARALLNLDLSAAVAPSPAPRQAAAPSEPTPSVAAPAASGPAPAPTAAVEPTAEAGDEAFVDTALCTSCNDCTNLNPLLFVYDANKQAHIGDLSKGTYLQLVTAAEKCPARCIHPGAPRPGDATATADVVARAAKFN